MAHLLRLRGMQVFIDLPEVLLNMSHTRVAIPLFGTRVSPRFDCAGTILLVEIVDSSCGNRQQIDTAEMAPHERINRLLESGVDTVVCGGIDRWSAESLQASNVKIYACNTGEAEDALEKLLEGTLPNGRLNPNRSDCVGAGRRGQQSNPSSSENCCRRRGRFGQRGRSQEES